LWRNPVNHNVKMILIVFGALFLYDRAKAAGYI
jgi:hypothetical protein